MLIIPAIDLYNGKVVRLYQGKKESCIVYSDDPLGMAEKLRDEGASLIHIVDLNASFGDGENEKVIHTIANAGIPLETGGGIRTFEKAERLIDLGVKRVIIGTQATDEAFLDSLLAGFKEKVAVSVDVLDGIFRTKGWQEASTVSFLEFVRYLAGKGVNTVIYTDIAKDGTLAGPSIEEVKKLKTITGPEYILSGGIGSMEDLALVRKEAPFVYGVIIGKAFYEGKINIKKALFTYQNP
ncbi:MAG: 1-(5-phosphoribosyl)-5-[(5-phosphoribosylamino)methylideneamino] imidazole-4-carboxamide isomerase [Candidatus Omnitrophica bacterium]|nr:1-(5-phosphoribosyl)-5-[(5-phosphoribosylamino)methylideneamino] imidazole-4-carboxamide isomerase [Candidatus Omnitrophota bacterium]